MDVILEENLKLLGFDDFRSEKQREATIEVFEGNHDVLIHLPPGSGKSLCYQLPAIASHSKCAIVFVPNISTSDDHTQFLRTRGVRASQISSSIINGKKKIMKEAREIFFKETHNILYVSVTLLENKVFLNYLSEKYKANLISFLVVDEASCVSEKHGDYNKSYELVKIIRSSFPDLRLVALTSTVTSQVQSDIIVKLGMENASVIKSQIRIIPNIYIDVNFLDIITNPVNHMIQLIEYCLKCEEDRVIIFCRKVEQIFAVSKILTDKGVFTVPYSDRLKKTDKSENRKLWTSGKVKVIAVTHQSIFWLNYKSVRCVIHWTMPSTMSQYHREISTAGRDGKRAICRLYYSLQERLSLQLDSLKMPSTFFDDSQRMIDFCFAEKCRHALHLAWFDVTVDSCHKSCDYCYHKGAVKAMLQKFTIYESSKRLSNRSIREDVGKTETVIPTALKELPENLHALLNVYAPFDADIKYLRIQDRWFCYYSLILVLNENYEQSDEETRSHLERLDIFTLGRMIEYLVFTSHRYKNLYFQRMLHTVNYVKHSTEIHETSNFILNYHSDSRNNSTAQDSDCMENQGALMLALEKFREDFILANGRIKFYIGEFEDDSWDRIAEKL